MNLAFPALLILLLVLPGIILRYAYLRGLWPNTPYRVTSVTDEVAYGVLWAAVLHLAWASLLAWCGVRFDLAAVLMLLTGSYGEGQNRFGQVLDSVALHPYAVAGYFLGLYLASSVLGVLGYAFVHGGRFGGAESRDAFRPDWHYLFSGECRHNRSQPFTAEELNSRFGGVFLSSVVSHADGSYLYIGYVSDYFFDRSGNLDRVVLLYARRRKLSQDRGAGGPEGGVLGQGDMPGPVQPPTGTSEAATAPGAESRFYPIRGHFLVLRYAEMHTINIQYVFLGIPEQAEDDGTLQQSQAPPPREENGSLIQESQEDPLV